MNPQLLFVAPPMIWRWMLDKRLKPAEFRELQNKKLRALTRHSYEHVPYYNSLFRKADITPDDVKTIDDLDKIPITRKKDIIDLPLEKIVASNIDLDRCWLSRTSGTSGTSLSVYWEKKAKLADQLSKYLWQLECGDKITNKQVVIGARWVPESNSLEKLGIFRTKRISPFDDVEAQIKQIREFDPKTMNAYPSCIQVLANEIVEKDIQGINIHLIFPGGEILDERIRKLSADAFDAEVFNHYGAIEVGRICNECVEHNGYHTSGRSIVVEITRDGEIVPTGKEGDITVTNLDNYAMPFIRYDLDDLGILVEGECSCGSCFPRMKVTTGRRSDVIHLPDGRVISALAAVGGLNSIRGIRQFQVVQEHDDGLVIKVVKGVKFTDSTIGEVRQILGQALGDIELNIMIVDNIPRERSGKARLFVSKVPPR